MPTTSAFGKNALIVLGLFILYGWIEFEAFIWIGDEIGGLLSFIGIFITAAIGVRLLRAQGTQVFKEAQNQLQTGQAPAGSLFDAVGLLLGAFLMLLPGYVTDGLGLICFLPVIRRLIGGFVLLNLLSKMRYAKARPSSRPSNTPHAAFFASHMMDDDDIPPKTKPKSVSPSSDEIIEGDFEEKKER